MLLIDSRVWLLGIICGLLGVKDLQKAKEESAFV